MQAALRRPLLAVVAAGSLIVAAGCGGSSTPSAAGGSTAPSASATATTSPSTSPSALPGSQQPTQAPPAGFDWVGSSSQGIWLAVPKTWVALNLAQISLSQALRRVSIKGVSTSALLASLTKIKQHNGLFIADLGSASTSPHQFATNVNAFCSAEPIEPGLGAADLLDKELRIEYAKVHATVLSLKNVTVSTTALVIDAKLTLQTTAGYPITELQTLDLTDQSSICEVTASTDNPAQYLGTMRKINNSTHAG
jgi:hypothetical protein